MPSPRLSPLTVLARVLLVPYTVALALIVWLPATAASKVTGVVFRFARFVSAHTDISLTTSYAVFEFLANIALFVPLGLLLVAAFPRANAWVVLLIGYSASATIELVQTLLPSRYPTLSDVIANALGTAIGCLIARVFVRRHPPRWAPVEQAPARRDEVVAGQRDER
ncbi:VanZ family protein [Microbacterium sp.]|uniref:VanZ family protein n=1 Tax=Microbacterium sp. TaxID=51671 RepID=UPI0028AC1FD7|nr:VanZ family protein [Microbacterium sp.]